MTSYGVTLLSGGLDSTTVTAYAKDRVDHLTALTFFYGQTHSKEVDCARRVAELLGVEHKLLDISGLTPPTSMACSTLLSSSAAAMLRNIVLRSGT